MTERTWIHKKTAQRLFGSYARSSARLGRLVPVKYYGKPKRLGFINGYGYYFIEEKRPW